MLLKPKIMKRAKIVRTAHTLFDMRRWWVEKAKWYHIGDGHFNTELYLRICEAKARDIHKLQNESN